jgi:TrmH family RNA methyltransferase
MITSIQNPTIKQMRKLHSAKERRKQNLFLLEGTNLLEAASELNYPLNVVCYTQQWQDNHRKIWEKLVNITTKLELVSAEVLGAIATTVNPDGIVATAVRKNSSISQNEPIELGLLLERLQDPGNLGTIIRTATATGIDRLWLTEDSVDLDNPKVLRSSAGAWLKLPMQVTVDPFQLVQEYKQKGLKIIATTTKTSQLYWDVDLTHPTLILLGNEGAGLSESLISLADEKVKIPLQEGVESLNVAIATSLLLYEAQRQRYITRLR